MKKLLPLLTLLTFFTLNNQAHCAKVLHDMIAPGVPEIAESRNSLPTTLQDDQCVIACYRQDGSEIKVAGYYPSEGFYEGRVCKPDGFSGDISPISSKYSKKCNEELSNCTDKKCWAGGDTGGFYRNSEDIE